MLAMNVSFVLCLNFDFDVVHFAKIAVMRWNLERNSVASSTRFAVLKKHEYLEVVMHFLFQKCCELSL